MEYNGDVPDVRKCEISSSTMEEVGLYWRNWHHRHFPDVLDRKSQGDQGRGGIGLQQRPRTAAFPESCLPRPGRALRRPRKGHRSDAGGPDAAIIRSSLGRKYMDSERRDVWNRRCMFERVVRARGGRDRRSQSRRWAGLSSSGRRLIEGTCVLAKARHVGLQWPPARPQPPLRVK